MLSFAHLCRARTACRLGPHLLAVSPLKLETWRCRTLTAKAFGLPAVQAIITHKWDTWARRVLIWEFGLYLIWLLGFQAFIILFQVSASRRFHYSR